MSLSTVLLAWSSAYAATMLFACARARRFFAPPLPSVHREPVVVVRPCAGREALLRENLASTAKACAPGDLVLFAIARADDGAADDAQYACEVLARASIEARVVVTGASGPNRKADQLARALARVPGGGIVVVADSDLALAEGDISALLAPLADPGVAASWAPPCETGDETGLGDRAAAAVLDGSMHAFPLLAGLDGDGMVGKLMAVRRASLGAIGGFASLARHLGEDMELARRLRARGERTVCVTRIARARTHGRSFEATVLRFTRWLAVIRAQRPALLPSYPLLFCALPWFALGAIALHDRVALAAFALALAARLLVATVARAIASRPRSLGGALVDAFLADAVLLAAFVLALRGRDVRWRDRSLRLDRAGLLVGDEEGR